ncbi:hypothetical protein ACFL6I_28645, partial [candidate division KSB1 bacterium]
TPSNPTEIPADPATYSPGKDYQFNVTWTDNFGVLNVTIEHNFTGTLTNYSVTGNVSNAYYYDYTGIHAGTYVWKMIANDTSGNYNVTDQYTYTVQQAGTTTQLYLNGTQANLSTVFDGGFNATAVTDALNVSIYKNGTLVNESTDLIAFYYEQLPVGHYNITAVNPGNSYSGSEETWWITITKATGLVNLTLNGLDSNITIGAGDFVNMTARTVKPVSGQIELYDNGTLINNGTSPISNLTQFTIVSHHNITIVYRATENYTSHYETHWITVSSDIIKPEVRNVSADPDTINQGQTTNITANVTDNLGVISVLAEITFSNGTAINYTMESAVTDIWNYTFYTTPNHPGGVYQVRIIATDTTNNVNASETTTFTVNDITRPRVTEVAPNATWYNLSTEVNITTRVIDETGISEVLANVTWDATSQVLVMTDDDNDDVYNASFSSTTLIGRYNITIIANDTSNNVNNTETAYFYINDTLPPYGNNTRVNISTGSAYDPNGAYQFNFSWYDNYALDTIIIEHNLTGTLQTYSITGNQSNEYYYNYPTTLAVGLYVLREYANDTTGNLNQTEYFDYTVVQAAGNVNFLINGTDANYSMNEDNSLNLTGLIVTGQGDLTLYENGTQIDAGPTPLETLRTYNDPGMYNLTLKYNNTQNYTTNFETHWIQVNDTTAPSWTNNQTNVTSGAAFAERGYQFNITWQDNVGVEAVWIEHNFTGTVQNISITSNLNADEITYYYNYGTIGTGSYYWKQYANDSTGNLNETLVFPYIIVKAASEVNLLINATDSNYTINATEYANLTGLIVTGQGDLTLYEN